MPAPRKTGAQRGGNKKPAGQKQGRSGKAQKAPADNLVLLPGGKVDKIPDPPVELGKTAQQVWTIFWESDLAGHVTPSDHYALQRWIQNVQELEVLAEVARKKTTVPGSQKQPRLNPIFSRIEKLEELIARAEQQFGMTPLARMKLGMAAVGEIESADRLNELIAKRRSENAGKQDAPSGDEQGGDTEVVDAEFAEEYEEA